MSASAFPDHEIAAAARALREGALVAFPTETVYGLGADATNSIAVARLYAAKGRPQFNPLIVHVPDIAEAFALGVFSDAAKALAQAFWPGPLTLVVPRRPETPVVELATAGLPTIAIRVPSHPIAQALLAEAGIPVAAPSANRSGHVSATSAKHVMDDFGADVRVLDRGTAERGLESTIVDVSRTPPRLLRPGAIPTEAIETILGMTLARATQAGNRPTAPGQLRSHYAPRARLRLAVRSTQDDEALLAFGDPLPHQGPMINLSPTGDLVEAASRLFAALRMLDATGCKTIAVMPIPTSGLGEAINDRLARAAAPR